MKIPLAYVPHVNAVSGAFSTGRMFWIGLLIGLIAAIVLPKVVAAGAAAVIFLGLGGLHVLHGLHVSTKNNYHVSSTFWIALIVIVGVICTIYGLRNGRVRGLKHLSMSEFKARLTGIKKISSW